jgi:PHD/YefM family antitoxin component YafN of YafNO toxin-antitoxin module
MDKTLSVTSARQQLLKLTKDVRRRMDRVVLTNKGEATAILMSVGEYNSLKAAAELVMHPEVGRATGEGFEQLRRGAGKTLEEAFPARVGGNRPAEQAAITVAGTSVLQAKPAAVKRKGVQRWRHRNVKNAETGEERTGQRNG